MFRHNDCNLCGDCLTKCQWINIDQDLARMALGEIARPSSHQGV